VAVGRIRSGLRAYLAVAGGFDTPVEIGSRSSDVLSGLGPAALRVGDRLDLGPPTRPRGRLTYPSSPREFGDLHSLRVLAGPHRLEPERYRLLCSRPWVVGEASNRIGIRLVAGSGGPAGGHGASPPAPPSIPSTGMVTGAVQVPPDGNPIILMPDHATVGGYPVACCVISADLPLLGQLRPGDTVRLTPVDRDAALRARERWEASLDERVSGWFPTVAGT
jgi:allophanate hydrolase subunit 2